VLRLGLSSKSALIFQELARQNILAGFFYDQSLHKNVASQHKCWHFDTMSNHMIILEAIARRRCVSATYNRVMMKLAPHILYTKHGAMHVDAVALEKNGIEPKEKKLGVFKLDGLNDLILMEAEFAREDLFEPGSDRYAEQVLLAVD
jgi:hypothetical protein